MTTTEAAPHDRRDRPAPAAPGGPGPAHRRGASSPTTSTSPARCTSPSCAARTPTPASSSIDTSAAAGAARRRRRLHRRRPRRRLGGADAVRLAGHRRHEEPGALPAGDRQGRATSATAWPSCWPRSDAAAHDAVEAIDVEYEPLEAVIDLEDALSDRVVIHEDLGTNTSYTWALKVEADEGAVDEAFADAAFTVSERYVQQRLIPMAMEPRAVVAVPQPFGGDITLYSATQIPHILKMMTAITLGIPEHQVRVVAPAVGGGFGSKLNVYAEELLCMALARKHSVPVRWNETRSENAAATIHGRGQIQHIDLAADADGKLTGLRVRLHRRHGRLPAARHAGHPAARRVPVRRRVRPAAGLRLRVHVGVHDDDADRRLPRRRPPRGDVRHRAGDGRARRQDRRRPARAAPAQLHPDGRVPVHGVERARLRLRRPRRGGHRGRRLVGYDDAARPPGDAERRRAPRSASASACRRTSRCAASPRRGCSPR